MSVNRTATLTLIAALLSGCSTNRPMPTVSSVDIDRFMGDWYVIASIPTPFEKDIYNAVENYERVGPRRVQTTFTFRKGGFDGPLKEMQPVGFIDEHNAALWGMQFIWPIKADYRIVYLDTDYHATIIGREKRDYVWIMAREPHLDEATYAKLIDTVRSLGYDVSKINKVPQRWETNS
ncbi:lipocalin family protein [Thiosocius teredinicola]|uniref:lipocalin family protein n=1 Tax=Thiosocius teredinicola TaxID=1973002 RepID=UPI000990D899